LSESGFSLFSDSAESSRIMNSNIGQHLAVQVDLGSFQSVNKSAVGQAMQTSRRINARNPQSTELALTLATVTISILTGFDYSLFGGTVKLATGTVVTFGFT